MISTNDFFTGLTVEINKVIYEVIESHHSKMGRGGALVKAKLRNIENGGVIEKTFRGGEKVKKAHLDQSKKEFLYRSGDDYVFMDNETYEQITLTKDDLGDKVDFLKENMIIDVLMYQERPIDINLPTFVELKVVNTPPGIKGNTVSGGSKPATLETGAVIQVPLFVNEGDLIKIDTRTGTYIVRV